MRRGPQVVSYPENYILRVVQFAQQGWTQIDFKNLPTPIGTAKPILPSRGRTRTTRSG